jgi:YHS domain-containing protein
MSKSIKLISMGVIIIVIILFYIFYPNRELLEKKSEPLFAKELKLYSWTEIIGEEASGHTGGIIFQLNEGRVYSTAWWEAGIYSSEWPKVEGMGAREGNVVSIVYRNATGNPESDFYHAIAIFKFSKDWKNFTCHFIQQDSPDDKSLGKGIARGRLSEVLENQNNEANIFLFTRWFKSVVSLNLAEGMCPVIKNRPGKIKYQLCYQGKIYVFCCLSCVKAFKQGAKKYAKR